MPLPQQSAVGSEGFGGRRDAIDALPNGLHL